VVLLLIKCQIVKLIMLMLLFAYVTVILTCALGLKHLLKYTVSYFINYILLFAICGVWMFADLFHIIGREVGIALIVLLSI